MMRGKFITFEGGEGAGKSTQVRRLIAALDKRGIEALATREPGGAPSAEEIRSLLVSGPPDRWRPLSEALLLNAARNEHLERLIRPALEEGRWVISDRFADSTTAYQGYAQKLGTDVTAALEALVVGDTKPDLTIILDVPADRGLERAAVREGRNPEGETRYERFSMRFHETLRQAFLEIAKADPQRCVVIDAVQPEADVSAQIWHAVTARFAEVAT
ncbi:dTMP kinase [Pyruvatibacter sp.]|uniref:dTMP kinase n=1 Tax=Pyruvatibacter sp. TaxID=1981328 RepID=UPI0032EC85C8